MSDPALITAEQVETLNAARTVLDEIAKTAYGAHASQVSGMIYARAAHASTDLFSLLNWVSAYGHVELSRAQLHNEREALPT